MEEEEERNGRRHSRGTKKKKLPTQVRVVTDKRTGTEFAAKSIPKRLDAPGLAPERQAAHVDNIRREVAVLRRLRGTLNVVALEGAFEVADSVHIVMVRFCFCFYFVELRRALFQKKRALSSLGSRESCGKKKKKINFILFSILSHLKKKKHET